MSGGCRGMQGRAGANGSEQERGTFDTVDSQAMLGLWGHQSEETCRACMRACTRTHAHTCDFA